MKEIYIDIGNSYIKVARLNGINLKLEARLQVDEEESFFNIIEEQNPDKIIVCNVVERYSDKLLKTNPGRNLHLISYKDIPIELLNYDTPQTLGMDRFLACYGALKQTPNAVVVIDAGSACTVDFMSADSIYMGGVIMPGLRAMIGATNHFLPDLPEADVILPEQWPGKSTKDSLRWGTTGAFLAAIESYLRRFEEHYGTFDLFLTGGGARLIDRYISNGYEPKTRTNLVFEGMYAFNDQFL